MLTKFESKSNRVKGLSFHISRPWILTSLHNGVIQLWDYRMGTLLDRFDEHDGPVRGIDFHRSQPLFVSGGDDYKLKVWDYKLRRCLFTLLGHLDYIRTVQYHHEYPWILSSSDDQTVRIWNWQSRSCVSVLTGHNHYVMSAMFHPREDLVVSASLDQTVRVWDTTGLRKKTVRGAPSGMDGPGGMGMPGTGGSSRGQNDLFGGNDAVVKYVLEGHDRGVNYAAFHPTLPLIVSSADDRQVKLWRMNETKAWEVDTMRGHTNNVSCVLFHPRHELIISNSEDRSIRVWDISKRMGVQTFRRETDRFWILSAHQKQNLLAAGHDSGMIVFKLERERPAMESYQGQVFYVKERYMRVHEFESGRDLPVVSLRRTGTIGTGVGNLPRTLNLNTYNPNENNVLLVSDADGGSYELFTFSKENAGQSDSSDAKRGSGLAAVFVARNRFAVLDKSRQVLIKNFDNEVTKKINPPGGAAEGLFFAGTVGRVLLKVEDKIMLYETQSRRVLNTVVAPRVKYVIWSDTYSHVALLSKHGIVICNRQLESCTKITETVRIKSGIWDSTQGIFIYTTLNHIKYCLPNGDGGILRTLDVPVYLTAMIDGNSLHCLDREGKARTIGIDLTECQFKIALSKKKYSEVMRMVKHSRLCGRAIITYLTEKGYPEVALHFVNDEKTRFSLAISCGNLEVALNSAYELDNEECWNRLGLEALRQGNVQVVEMAYQRTKDFERLSFLYLLTGNRDKLKKMMKIAEMRGDVMSQFHNALYLGDAAERVKILENVGQHALALLTAETHGLTEDAERLRGEIEEAEGLLPPPDAFAQSPKLLVPPVPIVASEENWPLLSSTEPSLEEISKRQDAIDNQPAAAATADEAGGDEWGENFDSKNERGMSADFEEAGDEWDEDLDLGDDDDFSMPAEDASGGAAAAAGGPISEADFIAAPTAGTTPPMHWVNNSSVAADHVAAGSFETAMQLLNRQIGVVNFAPLKPLFMAIYSASTVYLPTTTVFPSLKVHLQRSGSGTRQTLPYTCLTLAQQTDSLKSSYRSFTAAKFDDVKSTFETIMHSIPLLSVASKEEESKVKELLGICREYLMAVAIRAEMTTVPLDTNPARNVELSAYFTHCKLQPSHLLLTLKIAMTNAFKSNNYIAAASFCRRLLELPEIKSEKHAKLRATAKKVLQKAEKEGRNEVSLDYDETKPFEICAKTLTPIYRGTSDAKCPFCAAVYKVEFSGSLCEICGLSRVGEKTLGLVVSATSNN